MVITTSPLVKTYTLQEFWDLPEPPDHSKLELIKGVLYMTPPPDYVHNDVVANIARYIQEWVRDYDYRGTLYVPRAAIWVDDDTYLEPDLMVISDELKRQMKKDHWTRADLVIEVVSPSNEVYGRTTKSDTYHAMGVRELWLVYAPKQKVEVRSFEAGKTAVFGPEQILRSEVLPGFERPVGRLFS